MPANSLRFSFRVPLPASADRAYAWATDFGPGDLAIMGLTGRRTVERLNDDTLVLTDTSRDGRRTVRKVRLIRLRPKERSWVNTHIAGPNRHSQFLYRIVPVGRRRSRLEYTALQIEYGARALSSAQRARRALEIRRDDRGAWTRIVRAMKRDLSTGR